MKNLLCSCIVIMKAMCGNSCSTFCVCVAHDSLLCPQELSQENQVLTSQVQAQMMQISGLKNQLDALRQLSGGDGGNTDASHLRKRLGEERESGDQKDLEVCFT